MKGITFGTGIMVACLITSLLTLGKPFNWLSDSVRMLWATRAATSPRCSIMDGLPGLESAFRRFFPRAQTQRCQKHAKANACRRVRKKEREVFSKALHEIFYAPTESAARAAFFTVKQQWGRLFPSAVQVIERDLDSLLTFFQFDPTYWTVLRTTNPIERLNKEFKRRTKAMEVTGGEISTYRCLVYVSQTMEYRWSFHPLSQWSTVYTLNAA
jgi:putative transposase